MKNNKYIINILFFTNLGGLLSFLYLLYIIIVRKPLYFIILFNYPLIYEILFILREGMPLLMLYISFIILILYVISPAKIRIASILFILSLILMILLSMLLWALINRLPLYELLPPFPVFEMSPILTVMKLYFIQNRVIKQIFRRNVGIFWNLGKKKVFLEILKIHLNWGHITYMNFPQIEILVDDIFWLYQQRLDQIRKNKNT